MTFIPRHQWATPCHPDTAEAFEHIDAAMFTGDPGETREKFDFFQNYLDRWVVRMASTRERLAERENAQRVELEDEHL